MVAPSIAEDDTDNASVIDINLSTRAKAIVKRLIVGRDIFSYRNDQNPCIVILFHVIP